MNKQYPNRFDGTLRKVSLRIPQAVYQSSGILVFGRRIKSLVFTTDLATVRNVNADASLTQGDRVVQLASYAEMQGAAGVVVNAPTDPEVIRRISRIIDIPIVVTAVRWDARVPEQIDAGAAIVNVAGAAQTPEIIRRLRADFPDLPVIASGGNTDETILKTIEAGANAISWTPPATKELFSEVMRDYRAGKEHYGAQ